MGENQKQEKIFITFVKDAEGVNVKFDPDKSNITVGDVLLGVTATIKMVMEETGKDQLEVFKVISEMIDKSEKNKSEKGE